MLLATERPGWRWSRVKRTAPKIHLPGWPATHLSPPHYPDVLESLQRGGGQQAAEDWWFPCSLPRGNPLFQAELGLNHPYSATSGVMVSSRAS